MKMVVLKKTDCFKCWAEMSRRRPGKTSWAGGQSGCWAELLPGRWWLHPGVCSAPHRSWWRVGGDEEWSSSSCCLGQRSQPARGTILLRQYFGHNWYNILKIFNIKIDMLFKCFGEHISPIYLRSKHIQPVL